MIEIILTEGEKFDTLSIKIPNGLSDIDALKEIAKNKVTNGYYVMTLLKIEGKLSPLVLAGLVTSSDEGELLCPYTYVAYNGIIFYVNKNKKSREADEGGRTYEVGDVLD